MRRREFIELIAGVAASPLDEGRTGKPRAYVFVGFTSNTRFHYGGETELKF